MLRINDFGVTKKELIVLDISRQEITNFFGARRIYTDLNRHFKDKKMIEDILLHTIKYIANIHNKSLFHGDIKPANIFYYD
jgi:hypothetical protein